MSTDRYISPLVRALCQQGNAVHFFSGHEVSHLEKIVDRSGRDRKRTWTEYHPGAD